MDCVDDAFDSIEPIQGEIERLLKEKLSNTDIMTIEQYETLEKKDRELLKEIYNAIIDRQNYRDNYLKAFKDQAITISAIVDQVKVSRRTIYNKDFALKFIEKIQKENEKTDPFKRIEALKEQINELNEMILKMQLRDIEVENIKSENNKLSVDLHERIQAYKALDNENFMLLKRVKELEDSALTKKVVKMTSKGK